MYGDILPADAKLVVVHQITQSEDQQVEICCLQFVSSKTKGNKYSTT